VPPGNASPLILLTCLAACALLPEWQRLADEGDLDQQWLETERFRLLVLQNAADGDHLRIFIDGDGTPWLGANRVSIDPTPNNPVLLRLMHDADFPAVYLGRPCYFGTSTGRGCSQRLWTFDRYGAVVVASLCEAANRLSASADSVELFGYSGGGALVIRMSACTDKLRRVTTIAGNLDPAAWAEHHGYTPLNDTVLPAQLPTVAERHWQCAGDEVVPPSVTDNYFRARPDAERLIVSECTHSTGWEAHWQQIVGDP
jgi:hypothetical protein